MGAETRIAWLSEPDGPGPWWRDDRDGMRRTARGDALISPVSALRRAAQRAGVPWPYTARGRPGLRRRA